MRVRGLWVHVSLLAVASAGAMYVWARDTSATAGAVADVTVWTGRVDDVQRIAFQSSSGRLSLEGRADALGRWFLGTTEPAESTRPDGGVTAAPRPATFVSVAAAQKVAQALAPFKAIRRIGKLDSQRAGEFGLKDPASTVVVTIDGREHRLAVGASTPGGADRYVRDDGSGYVYAARAEFVRDLESGAVALAERELHDGEDADVESIRIVAGGKTREVLRRGSPAKRIWADPASPDKADETVANWLSKVDRLRPSEYVGDSPGAPDPIVRLVYSTKPGRERFLEMVKVPAASPPGAAGPAPGKPDYLVRTERTRLWARVYAPSAEQVEQDLSSVLK